MAPGLATAIGQRQSRARRSRARDCLPRYEEPVLARFRLTLADASGKTDRPLNRTGTIGSPRTRSSAQANAGPSFPRGAVVCRAAARRLSLSAATRSRFLIQA